MLRYTRCNTVILMAATAWLMSFSSCIGCGFDSYTVLFKDIISYAVAAIKVTMLHRVYLNMMTARLLTCCSNTLRNILHIQTRERISQGHVQDGRRATFSWPTLFCTSISEWQFLDCVATAIGERQILLHVWAYIGHLQGGGYRRKE